jgi:hypothetical protein
VVSRIVWLAWLLIGCVPVLSNGHYACGREGECPAALPHCHGDGRCHAAPEGETDGGRDDAGAGWAHCREPTSPCAAEERCVREVGELEGYCAPMLDGDCPGGVPGPDGFCRLACSVEADCVGTDCTVGRWRDGPGAGACVEATVARPDDFASSCTLDSECDRPLVCVGRRCGRRCDGTADVVSCGPGEICGPRPEGGFQCLVSCAAGETCPTGTACMMPGGAPAACLPMR